jgi:alpha-L-rhamnosidase
MFGEIGAWYYKALGGIKADPAQPGFKNILLEPHFVEGLDRFEARHDGPYGEIVSSWERKGSTIIFTFIIPPNSTATWRLPVTDKGALYKEGSELKNIKPGDSIKLLAGTHLFEWRE